MSPNGPKKPLEIQIEYFTRKTKSAQNKLKTLELARKLKIVHVVWIWAQTAQRNPLKYKSTNFARKTKSAQNKLKMPELARISEIDV